jgi:hypothetical protein
MFGGQQTRRFACCKTYKVEAFCWICLRSSFVSMQRLTAIIYYGLADPQDVQPYSYEQSQLPPSHSPSPPLPPWHTPSPPPPPSYSPPPLPPGYEIPREVTPPPYTQFELSYSAAQVTYESPVEPESYYTPPQQFPPVNEHPWQTQQQPQPSGQTGNGWEQTWGGFWPQNN